MNVFAEWLKRCAAFFAAHWEKLKKLGITVIGWTSNSAVEAAFNYVIYPFIIVKFGVLLGVSIAVIASFTICCLTFRFYDWSQKDWFGIEKIKEIREGKGDTKVGWFASRFLKGSKWLAFVYITFKFDAFMATIFMREGAYQFNELSRRDKKIFLFSFFLSAITWWPLVCGVLYGGEWAWETWFKDLANIF
ncbi:MAG: hypothetical protein FJZ04_00250 [Candidatus Moranbacteria bacterium]|nr:hypothetical protein [Candidatus Moranbacteria bacterium]